MEKINFANNQAPYINATNLNTIQNNIEQSCEGIVLFDGNIDGTSNNNTGTLIDNYSNYKYIEVFANRGSDYGGNSSKFLTIRSSSCKIPLYYLDTSSSTARFYTQFFNVTFNDNTFTVTKYKVEVYGTSINTSDDNSTNGSVYRIIGYK